MALFGIGGAIWPLNGECDEMGALVSDGSEFGNEKPFTWPKQTTPKMKLQANGMKKMEVRFLFQIGYLDSCAPEKKTQDSFLLSWILNLK